MEHKKNEIKVSAPASTLGLHISTTNTKQVISATNNRAQYYADLAKKYRDEAKQHRDNAKYYAEQNSDVTVEYILEVKADVLNKMSEQKTEIETNFETQLPKNVSELNNDIPYVSTSELELVTNDLENKNNETLEIIENISNEILNKSQITNCLLEVPQNIKLELNNGTLTLKAGSKVIVPNGVGVFDEKTISSDLTVSPNSGEKMFFLHPNGTSIFHANISNQIYSGTTQPSITYGFWYDTTNNDVKFTSNGSTWTSGFSLPFAKGNNTSINQVFNGLGYVGSTVFCDKGVKGLAPNGRNADGTLNNIEFTTQKVLTGDIASSVTINNGAGRVLIDSTGTGFIIRIGSYDAVNNYVLGANGVDKLIGCVVLDNGYVTNGHIDSFDFKLPFHAVDYNEFNKSINTLSKAYITETYVSGTSWYRVWSDKWCEQGGISDITNNGNTITLLKSYINQDFIVSGAVNARIDWSLSTPNSNSLFARSDSDTTYKITWKTAGYIG